MPDIGSVNANLYAGKTSSTTSTDNTKKMAEDKTSLTVSDFYKLLAAQMKYQDADNPMDTSEMMAQMVQTQMVQAITDMTTMSTTTYAASMVGKEVTVAEVDSNGQYIGKSNGLVTGVVLGSTPVICIGNKSYFLSQIMLVGKEPVVEETKPNPDEPKPEEPKPEVPEGGESTDKA